MRDQPALMLTLSYLLLTALGMGYQFAFFLQFRVNILDYAEISDFLLAAVREPAVILMALLPLPLLWLLHTSGAWLRRRSAAYAALANRTDTPASQAVLYPFFIAVYFLIFASLYAERVAESIKSGEGKRVIVELAFPRAGDAPLPPENLLLGKTSAFIFLYAPAERRTHIIPIENIARIIVVRPVSIR